MALKAVATMAGFNGVQAAFNAASALVATAALGAAERGVMVIGLSVGSFVALFGGLGTGVAFRARYPSSFGEARSSLVGAYTWWSLTGAVAAPMVAIAAVAASASFIDERLAGTAFLLAVGVYTASQIMLTQLLEAWYADGRFSRAVASGAVMSAASLLAVLVCLATRRSPTAFLLAQGVGTITVCVVVAAQLVAAGLLGLRRIRLPDLVAMLAMGVPALGVSAGLAVVLRADRYVLGIVSGPVVVGVYSLAATMSEIPRLFPIATGQLMLHQASLGRGVVGAARLLRTALLTTALGSVLVGVAGWALIPLVFGPEFDGARPLLVILVVAEVCFAPYALASRGLLGGGWTGTAGCLGMVGAIGAVACYPAAAHVAGATGAAVASVVVYAALSAASWALLRRRFRSSPVPPRSTRPAQSTVRG
jgi:O-antigen/teichoic acid export membrane protein